MTDRGSGDPQPGLGDGIAPDEFGIGRLFGEVREGVIVADAEGHVVAWNEGATRALGYGRDEAVGMNMGTLVPETLKENVESAEEGWISEHGFGAYVDHHASLEMPLVRKDGREIRAEVSLMPIRREGDPATFVLLLVRDETARAHLTERLEFANQRMRQAVDALESFTYVVSHDLKEPVRAMHALHRALEEDEGDRLSDEGRELLGRAREANERLDRLVRGLLEISRASSTELRASDPVALETAFRSDQTSARFQDMAAEREARIHLQVDADVRVRATVTALAQVFGNLVANAIRHNPAQRPSVHVRALPHSGDPRFVEVVVADDGPGFPEVVRDRFEQGLPQSTRGKTGGFGLLIVRQVVEALGGRVWLAASPDGGAAVHFTLPAA